MFDRDTYAQVLRHLCVIVAGKVSDLAIAVVGAAFNVFIENGGDVTFQQLLDVSTEFEGKVRKLTETQATRLLSGLELLSISLEKQVPQRSKPATERRRNRNKGSRVYNSDTPTDEVRRISRLVAEWRISEDGSRPLRWSSVRAELGLNIDDFHKVIRMSPVYREEVLRRIKELQDRPEGWEYCSEKLGSLTGLDKQGYSDAVLAEMVKDD